MESLRSLSRLELGGWPSGTGRSSTSSSASQTGAERPHRPLERSSQESEDPAVDASERRRRAEQASERAGERRREARDDRKQRFEERLEQRAERRRGARSGAGSQRLRRGLAGARNGAAGSSKSTSGGQAGQKTAAGGQPGRLGWGSGSSLQVLQAAGWKSFVQAPSGTSLPFLAPQVQGAESATGSILVAPGLLPTQAVPMGAFGFASGSKPAGGLAQGTQGQGLNESASLAGTAEAGLSPAGQPVQTQGAEAPAGDALTGLQASGEVDADPRLEANRREAPVREAAARASDVDTQRALRAIDQVRVQLRPGQRTAEIQLAPAELGRLAIRLKVERGNVHAVVRVEQPETLAALERFLPELRAALSAQGLDVGGMDLGLTGDRDTSFSESLAESAPRLATTAHDTEPTAALERHVNLPTLGVADDAVDTFA